MSRRASWLRLVGGLIVIALAAWVLWSQGAGSGEATTSGSPSTTRTATASASSTPTSGLATIRESALPPQARETLRLIRAGGPYPYARDGIGFGNREGVLPERSRGYYKEYTVRTPGVSHRGPRRIITGSQGDRYYTDDHYESFRQVVLGQ
ncbi:ribonuclease domain-containing protein [Janibacter sp. GXQ6167]|uniref:ribonuclease domain-containing protein n=1 Tax=Janibacter sp. GXQ6167 TaxID=3240791 RepID=UPI0035262D6C